MSYDKPRINDLDMDLLDIIKVMSEGNIGAVTVLCEIIRYNTEIDPDTALGPLSGLCGLDNLDCYGSKIWTFYKDVCGHDLRKLLGLERAVQMGIIREAALRALIDGDKAAVDIPATLAALKIKLPKFQIEKPVTELAV